MKKKLTKKSAPKSEFFDLDQVLEIASGMKDGTFYSRTNVCQNGKMREESVFADGGLITFISTTNAKNFKSYTHQNGKWS